jgi:hypothetical protein
LPERELSRPYVLQTASENRVLKWTSESCSETRKGRTQPLCQRTSRGCTCVRRVVISGCIREPVEVARVLEF